LSDGRHGQHGRGGNGLNAMGAAATALLVAAAAMLLGGLTLHRQAQQEQLLTAVVADLDSEFSALSL